MEKPVFIRLLIAIGVAVIIIAGIFLLTRKDLSLAPQPQIKTAEEKVPSQTTKTYTDEAGFSFNYPDDLTITKKESTSSASYSNIEIASKFVSGMIKFAVEDTKAKTTSDLFATNAATKDIKFGTLDAKEFINKNITTAAIDQGILFRLDVLPEQEKQYWQQVYNTILSSFSFVAPQAASDSSGSGGGEDVILEEEVIE